jgi:hypothetical protein
MMLRDAVAAGLVVVVVGCGGGGRPAEPSVGNGGQARDGGLDGAGPIAIVELSPTATPSEVTAFVGRWVRVRGVAANESLGAMVVTDDHGGGLYVDGLKRWPTEAYGKRVTVDGVLADRRLAPEVDVGADGEQRAGVVGTAWVLVQPRWHLD